MPKIPTATILLLKVNNKKNKNIRIVQNPLFFSAYSADP